MTRNRLIGNGNKLPWQIEEEYHQFLAFIKGQTVILGRKSFEIFGPDLSAGNCLVVSRSLSARERVNVFPDLNAALMEARSLGRTIYCAGGALLYGSFLPFADKMYISYIKGDFTGDTFFPPYRHLDWEIEKMIDHEKYEFVVYRRRRGK